MKKLTENEVGFFVLLLVLSFVVFSIQMDRLEKEKKDEIKWRNVSSRIGNVSK